MSKWFFDSVENFWMGNISHIWDIQCRQERKKRNDERNPLIFEKPKFIRRHLMIIHLLRSFQHLKRFENNHLNQKHNAAKHKFTFGHLISFHLDYKHIAECDYIWLCRISTHCERAVVFSLNV